MVVYPDKKLVFFLGIGGIGMSALARYFSMTGKQVGGYDRTETELTKNLVKEGINVHYDDDIEKIPVPYLSSKDTLVVYTPAIPADNKELQYFKESGFTILKRAIVLGEISKNYKTVAIAGTHGKTTTSSILAHILHYSKTKMLAFVGGINKNNHSNVIIDKNAELLLTEADEFDKSFLSLHPDILLITSLDPDHLDIYKNDEEIKKTYLNFASQLKDGGILITTAENKEWFLGSPLITYGLNKGNYKIANLRLKSGTYHFDLVYPKGVISDCTYSYPGNHNLENAVGAACIATLLEVPNNTIKKALSDYRGVKRRFEIQFKGKDIVYIDDYAHHPKEISACISAARTFYPGKKITVVFQPHLFTRTRDFYPEFAKSLSLADEVVLLDIYPARELPIEGISSSIILEKVKSPKKKLIQHSEVLEWLNENKPEVLLTLGAGDIDKLVAPIKQNLESNYE